MDLTSALEIRLHEAERRITVLLRNVKFVEEFRHLCRKERECEWETMGSIVVQPPSTPRPASTRPGCAAVAREAAPPAAQVEALEARVAKLEALDFEGRKEVSAVKNTAEALDFRVATLEAMDISLKAPETEKLLDPGSLANVTQLAEQALQEVSKVSELSTRLTERQAAMESQSEEFGRGLLGLLSDFQVHSAQAEKNWASFDEALTRRAAHPNEAISASEIGCASS